MSKILVIASFLLSLSFTTHAQSRILHSPTIPPPTIDGRISASEWQDASKDSGLIQLEPQKGAVATGKSVILTGMDHQYLYVGILNYTQNTSTLSAGNPKRDYLSASTLKTDDGFLVMLDTFNDHRSAYLFHVNILNTQSDLRIEADGSSVDANWDTEWLSATQKTNFGWSAELAIPFSSLKYPALKTEWGINFARITARNQEISFWAGVQHDYFRVSTEGKLLLQQAPPSRKPVIVIPYITERFNDYLKKQKKQTWNTDLGLDAEIPFSSDLTANVTVNPDFASVEGDQEQINLDLWEIRYPEKRPFFRDLGALFDTRIQVFYSRRIGDIVHGEKVMGKIGSVQIAGLYSRTNTSDLGDLQFPQANFSTVRLQKDILASSTLGFTAVEKWWDGGYHRVFSLDTKMRLPHDFYITGQLVASWPGKFWNHTGGFIRVARENSVYHYHVRYTSYGGDFKNNMNAVGFLEYDNVKEIDSDLNYNFWLNKSIIKLIKYSSKNRVDWYQNNKLWRYKFSQTGDLYLNNRWSLENTYQNEYRLLKGKDTYYKSLKTTLGYNVLEWSHAQAGMEWGSSFTNPFYLWNAGARFKPWKPLSLFYSYNDLEFSPDTFRESTQIHVLSSDIYFTTNLFFRVFAQYRSNIKRSYIYGLFGFRYRPPNSAVYLTYTYDIEESKPEIIHIPTNRILFIKFSHAFSL
ncbi:carbohydrate binding family 9 domain-containing protein [candidate division KSB1 bacterium]|nr:carbohydrate binding family 9 domain-containing protein [candidate division KSB1 bacterium]